jgi:hypothetical protein
VCDWDGEGAACDWDGEGATCDWDGEGASCTQKFWRRKYLKTLDLYTMWMKDYNNEVIITDMDKSGSGSCPIAV